MQFRHPHFFRPFVCQVVVEALPDVWDAVVAAGGVPVHHDGFPEHVAALKCRRSTFERAMWSVAASEPRLALRTGFVQRIVTHAGRATGVVVDGRVLDADLVVMAAGRVSHLGDEYRAPTEGGPCGHGYITRMYRAREGVDPPDAPRPMVSLYRGYVAAVFPQDDRTFSTLFHAPADDAELSTLRHTERWDLAVRHIPQLAQWTDPEQFEPITEVMRGGLLTNTYRGQLDADGNVPAAGLFYVGDAVNTTNPAPGRGISLGLRQAAELIRLLEHDTQDPRGVARQFDAWCIDHIRPWFEEQVHEDAALLATFADDDIDVDGRIPSSVICAAAAADPSLGPIAGPYLAMLTPPASIRVVEERVRDLLRAGWRPNFAQGPGRGELVGLLQSVETSGGTS
jgi:hypothetical protein